MKQYDGFFCSLPGYLDVSLAADNVEWIITGLATLGKTDLLAQHTQHSVIDPIQRHLTIFNQLLELLGVDHGERHFDILAGQGGFPGITHAKDEIGHNKSLKPPVFFQDPGQQSVVLPAPLAVDTVISAHDGCHALIHGLFEVSQVDLVQRPRAHADIDAETGIFHGV